MIWTVILFLVVLSVLVLAHEWGHYFTAKKMGMEVEEFGLGFPPRAFSRGKPPENRHAGAGDLRAF